MAGAKLRDDVLTLAKALRHRDRYVRAMRRQRWRAWDRAAAVAEDLDAPSETRTRKSPGW